VYPFLLFFGRLTVAKQPTGGYTTYLPKHNFCLYLDLRIIGFKVQLLSSGARRASALLMDVSGI
jgi:hypothetical protein